MNNSSNGDPIVADSDAIAAGVAAAIAATNPAQASSHVFYVIHGAAVNDGHADTVGAAGDPDEKGGLS
jgi:hypothetical protein